MSSFDFPAWMALRQEAVEQHLQHIFTTFPKQDENLLAAMRYSSLDGGKRIRPLLLFSVAEMAGADYEAMLAPACALELIHCYSLVHDDLPAMDDDDLRRGRPSCHKQFDEATAILAGDALQSLAFNTLATAKADQAVKAAWLATLAQAAGEMVVGQALDMAAAVTDVAGLQQMHQYKTGALITTALVMGGQGAVLDNTQLNTLERIGQLLGLAFQIQDDILDVTTDSTTLGKPSGSDMAANKPTYVALLGLDAAKQKAQEVYQQALDLLATLPFTPQALQALAQLIVTRRY